MQSKYIYSIGSVLVINEDEWMTLISYYKFDVEIKVRKTMIISNENCDVDHDYNVSLTADTKPSIDGNESIIIWEHEPEKCEACIFQNEIDRLAFENQKIYVRLVEEDIGEEETNTSEKTQQQSDIDSADSKRSSPVDDKQEASFKLALKSYEILIEDEDIPPVYVD